MSVLRKIICNVPDCGNFTEEAASGAGWPGWGVLQGRVDDATGETDFHLCPAHLDKVFKLLTEVK